LDTLVDRKLDKAAPRRHIEKIVFVNLRKSLSAYTSLEHGATILYCLKGKNAVIAGGTGMMTADDGGPEAQFLSQLTAFGRMGSLDEVVGAYNFLAGSGSTFITGQEIRVDGGLTAGLGYPLLAAVGR
jgi:hypothetical protein